MSYVPSFANDVYVSYSNIDNEFLVVDGDQRRGWVDVLVDKLRMDLRPRLGPKVSFRMDQDFARSNGPITPQILDAVRGSAFLLVVMSPSYLRSAWCGRAGEAFLSIVRERIATRSMLVIRAHPVSTDAQPEEFRDRQGIDLFVPDPGEGNHRLLGHPSADDPAFIDRIITVNGELEEHLRRLRSLGGHGSAPPPPPGELVFVAPATDDLVDYEEELKAYLKQAGLGVLPSPQSQYPTADRASFEAAVLQELDRCCVFAQLLSATRGRKIEFAPDGRMPALYSDLACRAQKPVLQWRERGLAPETVSDPQHRALLEGARACGIEEFKRAVVERARQKPAPKRQRTPQVVAFVNADSPDRALASDIGKVLAELGVDCYWPLEEGDPEVIRKDLEESLQICDGLVLVYGKTRQAWVQHQLRQARKALSARERPPSAMAIFKGPPPEKPDIAAAIPELIMLDCRNGVDRDEIRKFVDRLRT